MPYHISFITYQIIKISQIWWVLCCIDWMWCFIMCMFDIEKAIRFSIVIRTAKWLRSMVIFIFTSTFATKTKIKYTPVTNLAGITTEINWKKYPSVKTQGCYHPKSKTVCQWIWFRASPWCPGKTLRWSPSNSCNSTGKKLNTGR